jgi:hypothetical protein
MKKGFAALSLALTVVAGACSQDKKAGLEIQPGSEVTLEKKDGVKVAGRLVEVQPDQVIVETRGGRTAVARQDIAALRANAAAMPDRASGPAAGTAPVGSTGTPAPDRADPPVPVERQTAPKVRVPEFREVTAPAGTILLAELATPVSSETSKVEDPVRATLRQPLRVGGAQVLPAGTTLLGHVTAADRSARVKGRAAVTFRFTSIDLPGDAERVKIRTDAVSRRAPATKKEDAAKIGGGAAGGALIGAILGGGDGAAKGAAIGGAAGTGVVLSTRGKEVHLGPGADISVRLASPVTLRVPVR